MRFITSLVVVFLLSQTVWPQSASQNVTIQVHADRSEGPLPPIWTYFGYDEPNYTYAPNGKKLLGELAALDSRPVYVRVHNLLTTGDGSSSLKWGSTNVYTEDASGNPIYSWLILDQIFDTFHAAGIKPLVEIGFMPKALSTHPDPYRHDFPRGDIFTGWAYPPKDYAKWSELVFQFVSHLRERYGEAEVKTWLWEVWNEPDIGYWKGTRKNISNCMTLPSKLYCARCLMLASADPRPPVRQVRMGRIFCGLSSSIARTRKLCKRQDWVPSRFCKFPSQGIAHLAGRPCTDGD